MFVPSDPVSNNLQSGASGIVRGSFPAAKRLGPMATVLLVGEDEILLNTRAAVVRTTGVTTVCSLTTEALTALTEQSCDLVVLCHSVPDYVCITLADIIRRQWPGTRILRLAAGSAGEEDGSVAVCSADPESLVQRTVEMLGRRGPQRVPLTGPDAAYRERYYH